MCTTDDQGFSIEQLDCEQKDRSHPLKTEVKTLLLLGVWCQGLPTHHVNFFFSFCRFPLHTIALGRGCRTRA